MTYREIDEKLEIICNSLEPCPICKGKADIIGVHWDLDGITIDSVGCLKCNLVLSREMKWSSEPKKLFSKQHKNVVDAVQTWNNRAIN